MDPVVEAAKNRAKTTASKAGRAALFSKSKKGKKQEPADGTATDADEAVQPANAAIKKGRTN